MNQTRRILIVCLICLAFIPAAKAIAGDQHSVIRLSTTTSLLSSGLMAEIRSAFEADTGYTLAIEAVGTGRALRRAREGNTDVLIVHSPAAEKKFMDAGFGDVRLPLMSNEFILAGPKSDPAGVSTRRHIADAFRAIADSQAHFVSRGDDSGTHNKELEIWNVSGIEPYGRWYI